MATTNKISEGDFKSLKLSDWDRTMLEDAYQAVTKANKWGFLRRTDVPGDGGFMFTNWPSMRDIETFMTYEGHSGASYGMTMRVMEFIAKHGWDAYVEKVGRNEPPVAPTIVAAANNTSNSLTNFANAMEKDPVARSLIPDLDQQIAGVRKYVEAVEDAKKDPSTWKKSAGFPYPCPCHMAQGKEGWCGVAGFGVPACEH